MHHSKNDRFYGLMEVQNISKFFEKHGNVYVPIYYAKCQVTILRLPETFSPKKRRKRLQEIQKIKTILMLPSHWNFSCLDVLHKAKKRVKFHKYIVVSGEFMNV